jgi:hypothetical protein
MTLAPATCSTAACRKPFKARVRNGLKESRKCPACRKARTLGKPLPRKRGLRVTRKRNTRLNVDWPATHAQRFADRRSFVALDGRWYCFGQDMTARRGECYRRDKGICQKCGAHVLWDFGEVDHILSKGRTRGMTGRRTCNGSAGDSA